MTWLVALGIVLAILGAAAYVAWPRSGSPSGPSVLSPPTGVIAIAGEERIIVDWDPVAAALAYHLYGASAPGVTKDGYAGMPDGARYGNVVAPYTVSGLMGGKTYYFRVTATNAAGESGESGEVSATSITPPPGPLAPSPPTNVRASAGDGRITISWDSVPDGVAYHLYGASASGVTREGYGSMPDGVRYQDVLSPYTISGAVNGKTYYFRVTAENAAGESAESGEASATPVAPPAGVTLYVTGLVELDSGAPAVGASVTLQLEDGDGSALGVTGPDGRFNVGMTVNFPDSVLVKATYGGAIGPSATGFRWSPLLRSGGAVDVGRILLPDATNTRMTMAGTTASSPDGAIVVANVPPGVASLWARSYDPDAVPDAFPGDLAEGRSLPLNSVVFLWISALDANGVAVVDLALPATVRMRVPEAQRVDAEDLQPGNGVIDTPIYSLDYATGYWVREADGLLTDAAGAPIGEGVEPAIRSGAYAGDVYAEFLAGHFSWWNVDKPPTNCKPDFGDADDPPYPTLLASDGARHLNICRAWLGAWVEGEDDADARDAYDDGLLDRDPFTVRVSNFDWSGDLFLNALIDGNADGDWTDADEWVLQNLPVSVPKWKGKAVETDVVWDGDTWLRLTLTGSPIQDYDGTGEFAIGETEDYPFLKYRLSVGVLGDGTVTSVPAGIDCRSTGSICSAEFRPGTLVNLAATPDAEARFNEWGLDCSGTNATCAVRMDEAHVVAAIFTTPTYRLSVWVSGNGIVTSVPSGIDCRWTGGACSAEFPRGSLVNLTATANAGWQFDRWGLDCSGADSWCELGMDRDRSVLANFTRSTYRLSVWVTGNGTVTSVPAGIDCGSMGGACSAEFAAGALVNLTATPEAGNSFIEWGFDCSGSDAACAIRLDRDRFVSAAFTSPYYRLFVYVYGRDLGGNNSTSGGGTVTSSPPGIDCRSGNCSALFLAGTNVTLTAIPDPGWVFEQWAGDCTGTSPTCVVTMDRDHWVIAYFVKP